MATTILRFYALTLVISWIAWLPLVLSRTGLGWLPFAMPMWWTVFGTLGPAIAAFIIHRIETGNWRAVRIAAPPGRWVVGTMLGTAAVALTFVVGTALILTLDPPRGWAPAAFALYGQAVLLTLIGGPLFEEWGWRGFAQSRLQQRIGPLLAALAVGVGQGLWHLPLFLIPTWSSASLLPYVAMVTALSVMMAWGFNLAGGSVVTAILMHFTFNGSSRVFGGFLGDARLRDWPDPVTAILIAFVAAAAILVVATRGKLGLRREAPR